MHNFRFRPITIKDANLVIMLYHRHSVPTQGGRFALSVVDHKGGIAGVGIAGRPVARSLDNGETLEITRVCSLGGNRNVCSMIYARMTQIARLMGYRTVITYTLCKELGASLGAVGAVRSAEIEGAARDRKSRPRRDQNIYHEPKIRWILHRAESP